MNLEVYYQICHPTIKDLNVRFPSKEHHPDKLDAMTKEDMRKIAGKNSFAVLFMQVYMRIRL